MIAGALSPLRPHQAAALDSLKHSIAAGQRRPMLQAPTGAGKTVLAAHIVTGAIRKGNPVCFTVPALSLVDQTLERFVQNGIPLGDMGVIQADHPLRRPGAPVQIATAQTLARRDYPNASVIVVDEAHIRHKAIEDWITSDTDRRQIFIGLSATPWSKGLGKLYDDLIIATTTAELIEGGYLSKFRVFAPSKPNLDGVRTVAGDYHEGDIAERMGEGELTADIVQTWLMRAENRPTLCFAVNRNHARALHDRFEQAGVPVAYVDANTPREERDQIGKSLQAGEVRVVVNIGCLTTGIDWDVRCLILARPTKSEILFTQIIGRGLRTADGKDDCVLRGTRVLTDRGEVNIEDITNSDKVWDGVEFVAHSGAVCKGVRSVMTYSGLTATPDHKVMTDEGWQTLAQAASGRRWIARTGFGGQPLRFSNNHVEKNAGFIMESVRGSRVRGLQSDEHGALSQYKKEAGSLGMFGLQATVAGGGSALAVSALPVTAGSLLQSSVKLLSEIRRAWNSISLSVTEPCGQMDSREHRHHGAGNGIGSNKQRWSLRAWKHQVGRAMREHAQHSPLSWLYREVREFSCRLSIGQICRRYAVPADKPWLIRCANSAEMGPALAQAEGEVWDILNAGPRHRFTANGLLVHNCLILDHSDTHQRLGFVTDIHHDVLCDGSKRAKAAKDASEKAIPLPKCCPSCTALMPVKTATCLACGFEMPKPPPMIEADGELSELRPSAKRKGEKRVTMRDVIADQGKQAVYSQLLGIALQRGRKPGWCAHKYREIFDVWPRGLSEVPAEPTSELASWVVSQDIRYAKARQAHGGAA